TRLKPKQSIKPVQKRKPTRRPATSSRKSTRPGPLAKPKSLLKRFDDFMWEHPNLTRTVVQVVTGRLSDPRPPEAPPKSLPEAVKAPPPAAIKKPSAEN